MLMLPTVYSFVAQHQTHLDLESGIDISEVHCNLQSIQSRFCIKTLVECHQKCYQSYLTKSNFLGCKLDMHVNFA